MWFKLIQLLHLAKINDSQRQQDALEEADFTNDVRRKAAAFSLDISICIHYTYCTVQYCMYHF